MVALAKSPLRHGAVLFAALSLTACGSSTYTRAISVTPPEATVYINGREWGGGNRRPYDFDFSKHSRTFIQATCKDYEPKIEEFDEKKIRGMIATNSDVIITLRAR